MMKTSIKALILVLVTIGAIAGIFAYARTRVAPPGDIEILDQYSVNLQGKVASMDTINEFIDCHQSYLKLNHMLNLLYDENYIDSKVADEYRKKIDSKYGKSLSTYSFDLLKKSIWPETQINGALTMIASLRNDKLTSGELAVSDEFISSADKFSSVINDYHAALRLSRNVSYTGINDAKSRINKARAYATQDYLKNNVSLVSALKTLPSRIAQSHYNYVSGLVNSLNGFAGVSKQYYDQTLIPHVDKAIEEYKATQIYGNSKPSISDLEKRANSYINQAMIYYVN